MAYASIEDMQAVLPESITIGNIVAPSVTAAKRNTIPTDVAKRYLIYASQVVDSRISTLYLTPLQRVVEARAKIIRNMLPGSTDVMIDDVAPFRNGACVRLSDTNGNEINYIADIPERFNDGSGLLPNINHITMAVPTQNAYDPGSTGVVEMIVYPDPVPSITARFAVSFMFDRLFVSTGSPDVSNYGKTLRNTAREDLDMILAGATRLKSQQFIGKRFVRQTLFDGFKIPGEHQSGAGRE